MAKSILGLIKPVHQISRAEVSAYNYSPQMLLYGHEVQPSVTTICNKTASRFDC